MPLAVCHASFGIHDTTDVDAATVSCKHQLPAITRTLPLDAPTLCSHRALIRFGACVLLQVDFRERQYAIGKMPTSFTRAEGPPAIREVLAGRAIDRALRPLFPPSFTFDIQVHVGTQHT